MSPINKRSLWQKIKRRLAAALLRVVEDDSADNDTSSRSNVTVYPVAAENMNNDIIEDENVEIDNTKADSIENSNVENAHSENTDIDDKDADNYANSDINSDHSKDKDVENSASENSRLEKNSLENHDTNDNYHEAQEVDAPNDMSIVDYLKQYFYDKDWHYTYYRPRASDSQQSHHLSLQMRNKQVECGYLFRVQEANNLLAVYGILPFLIPESHQSAAMLLITQINYDMLIGNLEMDINDGEIRYKNAIDIEAVGIDDHIMEHLLQSVIAMTTVTYEIFSDLVNTADPAEDMATLLSELRQQADSRQFYLPTQFVQ
ncbi:YbjN domain-containing protein [Psychrobacter sp. GP33]|uniref:YbjN domain-containing protein n=1 Tax=Psychrobacter sp. GP33 TaxID=2758709 RepID=UPI0015F7F910|nr:YbjN domain-containing protein [Psychrobacter sp. GP33]